MKRSQSFSAGNGSIEHNLRKLKGRGIRQNGIIERRKWNEIIVNKDIDAVLYERVKDKLEAYNEKILQTKNPQRVKSFEDWKKSVAYTRNGKAKQLYVEYIVAVGNGVTSCPYMPKTDDKGNAIDDKGDVIPEWDTRRHPASAFGKHCYIQSMEQPRYKKFCRKFVERFEREHPNGVVVCAVVHCDELGGMHMHMDVIWFSETKIGIGVGISPSSAVSKKCNDLGIKYDNKSKTNNATKKWTEWIRYKLLPDVAKEFGYERLDMNDKRKHLSIDDYKKYADRRSEALAKYFEEKEREFKRKEDELLQQKKQFNAAKEELNTIRKQIESKQRAVDDELSMIYNVGIKKYITNEWTILKEKFPDVYQQVHTENVRQHTKENKKSNRSLSR